MSDSKLSAEDCFIAWKVKIKQELEKARYLKSERIEILDELAQGLYENGVDYDEAKWLTKKVQDHLVTKEGKKDSGKYKGWMNNVKEEYTKALVDYYEKDLKIRHSDKTESSEADKYYGTSEYLPRLPLIVAWTKFKYPKWSESLCLEAHRIGGPVNKMFQTEIFEAKWAKSGERPNWCKI